MYLKYALQAYLKDDQIEMQKNISCYRQQISLTKCGCVCVKCTASLVDDCAMFVNLLTAFTCSSCSLVSRKEVLQRIVQRLYRINILLF